MKLLATTLAVLAASTSLQAIKLAGDDFSYTTGTLPNGATTLNGGFGWSGAWTASTASNTVNSIVAGAPNFAYDTAFLDIPANAGVNGALQISNTTASAATSPMTRNFTAAISNNDIYVSFLVRYTAGTFGNGDSFYLYFGTAGTSTARYDIGIVGSGTGDFAVRSSDTATYTQTGAEITSTTNPASGSYLVVGKLTKSGGNYNSFTLWANPTSPVESQNTSVVSNAAPGDFANFSSLGFGYIGLDGGSEAFQVDNLQIGTTWEDVITPVPFGVDSTTGLALLGAAAAWKLRRRRAKA